jgi:hypothetical protein
LEVEGSNPFAPTTSFRTNNLQHAKEQKTAWCKTGRSRFKFHRADGSNPRWRRGLARDQLSRQFEKLSGLVHQGPSAFE